MKFKFVIPTKEYEEDAINYIKETIEPGTEVNGAGSLNNYLDDYDAWLDYREKMRNHPVTEDKVPGEQFFMVNEDNEIIGMLNLRTSDNQKIAFRE